jgi:hypothetical protein
MMKPLCVTFWGRKNKKDDWGPKILDNVLVVNLVLTLTVITFRRVSVNQQHFQHTSGLYMGSVCSYDRLVTELKPTK